MFEGTITLGALLSVAVSAVVGIGFIWAIKTSVSVLDARLNSHELRISDRFQMQDAKILDLKDEMKKLGSVLERLADLGARINLIEDRQLAQGKRIDSLMERVSTFIDKHVHVGTP
jgi:hypothetical protein